VSTLPLDAAALTAFIENAFEKDVVASLSDFIRIPNVSPLFDDNWNSNGLESRAAAHLAEWARRQPIAGLTVDVLKEPDKTSLLFIEVPAFRSSKANHSTVLAYAHFDKQPPLADGGWLDGLSPYEPVIRNGLLYGRGGGDDGYGTYSALTALAAVQALGGSHSRFIMLVEGSEESGSPHLMHYVDKLASRIGSPALVLCLDSGCENYDQLWMTSSLRGLVAGTLRVDILREGIHSGNTGVAASSFRILRRLLDRLENPDTGEIVAAGFSNGVPAEFVDAAKLVAGVLGDNVWREVPLVDGARPIIDDNAELILNRTWRPQLAITGVGGIPALKDAGNVLRAHTAVKVSLRLPPNVDGPTAGAALKTLLESDPMYGAHVSFAVDKASSGWFAPTLVPWLRETIAAASQSVYNKPPQFCGIGGSIPFMYQLGVRFPLAQFVVSGVMGPGSNAHGPNEFISIPFTKKFTACVAQFIVAQERNAPDLTGVMSFARFNHRIDTSGLVAPETLARVAEAGYKTVINLREASEVGVAEEKVIVESQGVRYVHVGISAGTFSSSDVDVCASVLADENAYPVLMHCASSNRAGAVLAVLAARKGASEAEAIAEGARGGLKAEKVVDAVRRVMASEKKQ
jgi:uncharacterized protein (TIGR01244 family)